MFRSKNLLIAVLVLAAIALGANAAREMLDVQVVNFPDPQRVKGTVTIEGPIRHGHLIRFTDIIVPPVKPTDTTRLISAGTVETDGYTHAVLSLSGLTKGDVMRGGAVGVFLVPEEELVLRTFLEAGQVQFPLEVSAANVSGASAYFASKTEYQTIGFPSYRVLLWNTSDKTVTVNLYAYLTY